MKVLVPYSRPEIPETIQRILGDEATVVTSTRDPKSMIEKGKDAVIIASGRVPGEYIRAAPNLKMIQTFGVGVNRIDREAVLERGDIIVCNNHVNSDEVAEYAIMLLMAAAKSIIPSDKRLRRGDWTYRWFGPITNIEIRGKKCLFLGLGNIGSAIAQRLRGFDVELFAATRTGVSEKTDLVDQIVKIDYVEPLVREADFVIIAIPLTDATRGLVSREFLSWMKPTSILVNVSRGAVVDEEAIYTALKEKRIHSAAFDVWWDYPEQDQRTKYPSEKYAFHELDNVVLSPHRAAYSENVMKNQIVFVGENILRFIRGEPLLDVVDMVRGY